MERTSVPIPDEVLESINEGKLILFIGAGFSRLCGLPSWRKLSELLIDDCISSKIIDYSTASILKNEIKDSKQLITISYQYFNEANLKNEFFINLKNHLSSKIKNENINTLLQFVLKSRAYVLTTNADTILHDIFEHSFVFYDEKQINNWEQPQSGKSALIHLHGCILQDTSLVFTSENYLQRYNNEQFKHLLSTIFNGNQTILFIGYGANELELLDYLMLKSKASNLQHKRFIVNGYYSYEEEYKNAMDKYYQTLQIEQIPYLRDMLDYSELVNILKDWLNEIESKTKLKSKTYKRLIGLVNREPSPVIVEEFIQYCDIDNLNEYSSVLDYLEKSIYSKEWIFSLYSGGRKFFDFSNFIPARKLSNGFQGVQWPAFAVFVDIFVDKEDTEAYLYKMALDLSVSLTELVINRPELLSNYLVVNRFIRLLFHKSEFIDKSKTLLFLTQLTKSELAASSQFIIEIARAKSNLLASTDEIIINVVKTVIDFVYLHRDQHTTYEFDLFVNAYRSEFSQRFSHESYLIAMSKISNLFEDNQFEFSEMGSLYLYPSDVYHDEGGFKFEMVIWLKESIKYLNVDDLIAIFRQFDDSNSIFSKTKIFMACIRFNDLSDEMFNQNVNPFDNWDNYSDMCFFIQENISKFNYEQIKQLIRWSDETNFGIDTRSQLYIDSCKYEVKLLISASIHAADFRNSILSSYRAEYSKIDKFYDKNKLYRVHTGWESNTNLIENKLKSFDYYGLIKFLKSLKLELPYDYYEYQKAITNIVRDESELLKLVLSDLYSFPYEFYDSIISALKENKKIADEEVLLRLETITDILVNKPDSRNALISIVWLIRERNFYSTLAKDAFRIMLKIVQYSIYNYNVHRIVSFTSNPYTSLINNLLYVALDMMLYSAVNINDFKSDILVNNFDIWIKEEDCKHVFRSSLASHIPHLELLCMDWLVHNIDIIFDNNIENIQLSYLCFSLHQSKSDFMYKYIQTDLAYKFTCNTNSKNRDIRASAEHLMTWHISRFLDCGDFSVHFRTIMEHATASILSTLFNYLARELKNENNVILKKISIIEVLVDFLSTIELYGTEPSDQVLRYLLELINSLPKNFDKSKYWVYAIKLGFKFDSYLSDSIVSTISNDSSGYEDKILDFLLAISETSTDWAFHSDIEKVRIMIKPFSNNDIYAERVNTFLNRLARKHPVYYSLIN